MYDEVVGVGDVRRMWPAVCSGGLHCGDAFSWEGLVAGLTLSGWAADVCAL